MRNNKAHRQIERQEVYQMQLDIYKRLSVRYELKMRIFASAFTQWLTEDGYRKLAKLRSRRSRRW